MDVTWRRVTLPLPVDNPARLVTRATALPRPAWSRREVTGEEAERWFAWAPILAMQEAAVTGSDGVPRYVALVPDLPFTEGGKTVQVQAVLWGPLDSRKPADGGCLYRTLAPARTFYEQLTKGRTTEEVPG